MCSWAQIWMKLVEQYLALKQTFFVKIVSCNADVPNSFEHSESLKHRLQQACYAHSISWLKQIKLSFFYPRQAKGSYFQYQLNEEPLRCVSHQRDLGVIVDEALKPHRQFANASKRATSIMRAIKASFINITSANFHKIYIEGSSAPTWNTHSAVA